MYANNLVWDFTYYMQFAFRLTDNRIQLSAQHSPLVALTHVASRVEPYSLVSLSSYIFINDWSILRKDIFRSWKMTLKERNIWHVHSERPLTKGPITISGLRVFLLKMHKCIASSLVWSLNNLNRFVVGRRFITIGLENTKNMMCLIYHVISSSTVSTGTRLIVCS